MKKLILSLVIVVNSCNFVFGVPSKTQIENARKLLEKIAEMARQSIPQAEIETFWRKELKKKKAYPKEKESFEYNGKTGKIEQHIREVLKSCMCPTLNERFLPGEVDRARRFVKDFRERVLNKKILPDQVDKLFIEGVEALRLESKSRTDFRFGYRDTTLFEEYVSIKEFAIFLKENDGCDSFTLFRRALDYKVAAAMLAEMDHTFLSNIVYCEHKDMFDKLLLLNPDLNAGDEKGVAPLMSALMPKEDGSWRDSYFAKRLIERRADVNVCYRGIRPLMLACIKEDADLVQLLIDAGADVNAVNDIESFDLGEITALDYAVGLENPNLKVLTLLAQHGGKLTKFEKLERADKAVIKILLEAGTVDIEEIPLEKLDDDVIALYVSVCKKRFPKEPWEELMDVFGKLIKKEDYLNRIKDWFDRRAAMEMEENTSSLESACPLGPLDVETVDDYFGVECGSGAPTVTQKNKNKRALADAAKAQAGDSNLKGKEEDVPAFREKCGLEIVFGLTPGIASRVLSTGETEIFNKRINSFCSKISELGITCTWGLNGVKHYRVSFLIDKEGYPSASKFVANQGGIGVASMHGGNRVCTDHYNEVFSCLIHVVCCIANDDPSKRQDCIKLVKSVASEGGELNMDALKALYPDVFSE